MEPIRLCIIGIMPMLGANSDCQETHVHEVAPKESDNVDRTYPRDILIIFLLGGFSGAVMTSATAAWVSSAS